MDDITNEEQALRELLELASREETVYLPLKDDKKLPVTLKGLSEKQISQIRERCTVRKKQKGREIKELDNEEFNVSLIVAATVSPNWGNPNILAEYKLSSPEEYVKRIASGYLAALGDKVLEISGFGVDIEEDVKN
ncbi:MAG: Phage XkdN-like protein [Pelotomaculum sp. PtaU1.Bin065]|nr:MAG: Phage XkdN-like protein [Pelotomaculum sp. PtaU1.Bin065]